MVTWKCVILPSKENNPYRHSIRASINPGDGRLPSYALQKARAVSDHAVAHLQHAGFSAGNSCVTCNAAAVHIEMMDGRHMKDGTPTSCHW
jgi:hypothetical protein